MSATTTKLSHEQLTAIVECFKAGSPITIEPWGDGHINNTYRAVTADGDFILQRLNTDIFRDPHGLMRNIELVTTFLSAKGRETLTIVPTREGRILLDDAELGAFRMYTFIPNTVTYSVVDDPGVTRAAGAAFGQFQRDLADFDASQLVETIPFFHHTPKRFADFTKAVADDSVGRVATAHAEIEEFLSREGDCHVVADLLERGDIPQRVTHNDTKINNILLDADTRQARAIIDLDTVMPGSLLYDFGDAMRTGAASTAEDDPDPSRMGINLDLFEAYCQGFVGTMGTSMSSKEAELLAFSVKLMTLECGMRFLADYLAGDVYFATAYPEHNLVRARTQLALVADIEAKMDEMNVIVERALTASAAATGEATGVASDAATSAGAED
ncbi:phosphotransferase enzyme family protein [Trueperella pecoris]|uniref:Aminoglycoside phosphotransferase family protein n=1 Tax=Trueperella pecoris TaxID=2733571 RepID=A0A7M1QV90_9ACTO|nr:aminoglycoside phosphotransferase family protein [Trueperella pecoris]QOR45743.1 aminoglycoside phosphotransferase family protein [Trueperella pecoris]QTG75583.1 aminoglycoside phosphotransferase family protein [Trueperella pecoris]